MYLFYYRRNFGVSDKITVNFILLSFMVLCHLNDCLKNCCLRPARASRVKVKLEEVLLGGVRGALTLLGVDGKNWAAGTATVVEAGYWAPTDGPCS